jgi:hypothetical protein
MIQRLPRPRPGTLPPEGDAPRTPRAPPSAAWRDTAVLTGYDSLRTLPRVRPCESAVTHSPSAIPDHHAMAPDSDAPGGERFLAGFALLSLASVAVGCAVAAAHGVSAGSWGRNLAAWGLGAVAAWVAAARASRLFGILLIAPVGLAATLLDPGQEGVHRWIDVGPVHVNAAATLLPAAVVALATLGDRGWAWLAAAAMMCLLVLQPDASQAAALGAGMMVVLASLRAPALARVGGAAARLHAARRPRARAGGGGDHRSRMDVIACGGRRRGGPARRHGALSAPSGGPGPPAHARARAHRLLRRAGAGAGVRRVPGAPGRDRDEPGPGLLARRRGAGRGAPKCLRATVVDVSVGERGSNMRRRKGGSMPRDLWCGTFPGRNGDPPVLAGDRVAVGYVADQGEGGSPGAMAAVCLDFDGRRPWPAPTTYRRSPPLVFGDRTTAWARWHASTRRGRIGRVRQGAPETVRTTAPVVSRNSIRARPRESTSIRRRVRPRGSARRTIAFRSLSRPKYARLWP